jgi:antitoxin component of MazEF toxin-antitoxin module
MLFELYSCFGEIIPLIRKIVQVGNAKAITIPKGWLVYWQRKTNTPIVEVGIEVDGTLIVTPILPIKKSGNKKEVRK